MKDGRRDRRRDGRRDGGCKEGDGWKEGATPKKDTHFSEGVFESVLTAAGQAALARSILYGREGF